MNHRFNIPSLRGKVIPALEITVFVLLLLFCLTAWLLPPRKIFSLRDALDASHENFSELVSLDPQHIVSVNLPPEFRNFYNRPELSTFRLYRDLRQTSPDSPIANELTFHLYEMLEQSALPTRESTGLFFYVVGINLRQSQYGLRAAAPSLQYRFHTNTPLTDEGKMLWYGRLARLPAVTHDAEAVLEMIRPASKGFLCDTVFFYAPALTVMRDL